MGVDRSNAVVELETEVRVVIELALGPDVELAAEEDSQLGVRLLEGSHPISVRQHLLAARAIDRQVLAVVGEGDVSISICHCSLDHLLNCRAPVAGSGRVIVKVALNLIPGDQSRQPVPRRSFDLTGPLPQWRGNELHPQRLVDLLLGGGSDQPVLLEQPVLAEQPAPFDGPLAKGDVVSLGSGEIEEGRPHLILAHQANVDLHPLAGEERSLGLPGAQELRGLRHLEDERSHRCRVVGDDHDVDVPDRLGEAPDRAAGHGGRHRGQGSQPRGKRSCQGKRLHQRRPPILAVEPETLDRPADLLLRDLAHPGQIAQSLLCDGRTEAIDVLDSQLAA